MSLEYNLQFFAAEGQGGEKTEPATEKKLTDARKEGQVAKSREVANGLGLLAVFLVLKLWVGNMGYQFMNVFTVIYEKIPEVVTFWHGNMPQQDTTLVFRKMMLEAVVIMAPLLLIGFLIAFLSDVVQVGWHPTGKTLQPKFSKMSPVSGFKRIFSVNSVVELIKSLLKIGLIVYICYNYLKNKWPLLYQLYDLDLMQAIGLIGNTVTDLGIRISLIYMIIAAADFIYQKVKFSRDMRMTKQEVKEEYKQQEGDPQIKGRIRQRMREASQRRMMQNLPQADVVITNPTHYAVAIKYDPEVANGLGLLAVFLVLKLWVGNMGYQFMNVFTVIYEKIPEVVTFWHGNMPQQDTTLVFRKMMLEAVVIMAPLLLIGFLIAFLSDVVQVGWHPTGKTLQPKFSKMSPVSGFKRIFSVNSVVELIKSLLKIGLIVYICYNYLKNKWPLLYQLYDLDLMQAIGLIGNTVTDLGIRISLIYMIIAAADFIYQKVKFSRDMRMTKQEVKEEYKQQEGDPQIKGRIRQRMREASQRRMMQNLPQADVVITNPTHYAVAIKYDPEVADAPIVIAKGEDYLAAKIKEIARDHQIEIVENKPLARMLYANVDVGQAVPPELYQAVAEVLAFVYHLQGKI